MRKMYSKIIAGKSSKGGHNDKPSSPRPAEAPKGQESLLDKIARKYAMFILEKEALKIDRQFMESKK